MKSARCDLHDFTSDELRNLEKLSALKLQAMPTPSDLETPPLSKHACTNGAVCSCARSSTSGAPTSVMSFLPVSHNVFRRLKEFFVNFLHSGVMYKPTFVVVKQNIAYNVGLAGTHFRP